MPVASLRGHERRRCAGSENEFSLRRRRVVVRHLSRAREDASASGAQREAIGTQFFFVATLASPSPNRATLLGVVMTRVAKKTRASREKFLDTKTEPR